MTNSNNIKKISGILFGKKTSLVFFAGFLMANLFYFITNFFDFFLNKGNNADEDYQNTLYSLSDFSWHKFFYTQSQPFVFISSVVDGFLKAPKYSVRLVSLLLCAGMLAIFVKKINAIHGTLLEKIYRNALFLCAVLITSQMYMGTSDFLGYCFLVPPFLMILQSIHSGKINLTTKQSILIGLLFALSIATRPTAMMLIAFFYFTILLVLGIKSIFYKQNFTVLFAGIIAFFLINLLPIVQEQRVVLDVKEIPKATGVDWFQRNYLMAKFWDSGQIPRNQWLTTQDVIDYKTENPSFIFPKNYIDLLIKEPALYCRQMFRMVAGGMYTSFRFMLMLFPILFLCFVSNKRFGNLSYINQNNPDEVTRNKIIIVFHLLSIIFFSFIAIKMLEFRWIVPIMILYAYYSVIYLSKFPEKFRYVVYTVSFACGILLYYPTIIKML
ncbi:hypothetical protein [Flavobacterium sp.]